MNFPRYKQIIKNPILGHRALSCAPQQMSAMNINEPLLLYDEYTVPSNCMKCKGVGLVFSQNNEMERGAMSKAGWREGGSIMSRKPTPPTPSGTRQERRATELRRKGVGYGVERGGVLYSSSLLFNVPRASQGRKEKRVAYPCVY